ncbi:MAG: cobalt-precorrin-5B (C(1))-methyltransferase, partial [Lachnospiraceae bacterium]|nr:cobalt-precorrin-5B (C(1))-methyltransferase [Lachnospiraceae bacterium]
MEQKKLEDYYVIRDNKKLRFGYTTGSCAAAAAKGAAQMLLSGKEVRTVQLMTPKRILLTLSLLDTVIEKNAVTCAVKKDGGDDPDTTHGLLIYVKAEKQEFCDIPETAFADGGVILDGGEGVGRVTKPGLSQRPGQAAINRVPRQMIFQEVQAVMKKYG